VSTSILISNTAASGGGILNDNSGPTTMSSSKIISNTAASGGGIYMLGGHMSLTHDTLNGNAASFFGGGIYAAGGYIALTNSTLSYNAAGTGGGIDQSSGGVTLSYMTVASNTTGIVTSNPPTAKVALIGTIVANSTAGPNCSGPLTESGGYNLDSSTSCGFHQPTDITATNPLLGALAKYGGPTETMALLPGSPAIGHAATQAQGCLPTDQRWAPRPPVAPCDIGAYERSG
jgi:hypothetical protein